MTHKFRIAKHYWKGGKNATWVVSNSFDRDVLAWLKNQYSILEEGKPSYKVFEHKSLFFFYTVAQDVYGRRITEILAVLVDVSFTVPSYIEKLISEHLLTLSPSDLEFNLCVDNSYVIGTHAGSHDESKMPSKPLNFKVLLASSSILVLLIAISFVLIDNEHTQETASTQPVTQIDTHREDSDNDIDKKKAMQLKHEFAQLYNEVKESRTILEIPKIVGKQWRADFPEGFTKTLKALVQNKIAEMDSAAINVLNVRFESARDVDDQKRLLEEIDNYSVEIQQIAFNYERTEYLKNKLKNAKLNTEEYKEILDNGVRIRTISFGAIKEENKPLSFACGDFKGNEILLKFGDVKFTHKESVDCINNEDGSQVMRWKTEMCITAGSEDIEVIEKDWFFSESMSENMPISERDLLSIYNNGGKRFPFPNAPVYFIAFAIQE